MSFLVMKEPLCFNRCKTTFNCPSACLDSLSYLAACLIDSQFSTSTENSQTRWKVCSSVAMMILSSNIKTGHKFCMVKWVRKKIFQVTTFALLSVNCLKFSFQLWNPHLPICIRKEMPALLKHFCQFWEVNEKTNWTNLSSLTHWLSSPYLRLKEWIVSAAAISVIFFSILLLQT